MILVDTSVWVDHLRAGDQHLRRLLEGGAVLAHPWVVGELSLGRLQRRSEVLGLLGGLPAAAVVTPVEMLVFVERFELMGRGIGFVDAQLLASARLAGDVLLWTRDRRLAACAADLGQSFDPG